ncbi:energy transducer TonB [Pseudomonas typographi]|uniref:Energy transducer TonB n=1 Tax=Pseudomonas typographi TaxID=2715964 RepID=A0ABR7YX11_9PSED|nr:energy transducer TonB [Pseudomonas typographi]MBD1597717.1 energy transducer TonB [Pseudomonas typographi]
MTNLQSAARAVPLPGTVAPVDAVAAPRQGALSQWQLQRPTRPATSRREGWLLGALVVALHGAVLYWATQRPTPALPVVPPEIPPMTIEFSQPAPPPPPVVEPPPQAVQPPEPPPPVEDELATKPPPKPKPKPVVKPPPKPVPKQEAKPVETPTPPPKAEAPPAPPAPPAPAPVTPPSATAGYLKNPAPEYPALAQRRGWEGTVLMRVHVLANGRPGDIQIQQSAGRQQLDDAALAAVKRWSFVPAKQGNQPVDGWVTVPIDFKIR